MRRSSFSFLFCCVLLLFAGASWATTGHDPFPVHASMRPNVEFWKKVYAEYPSTKGILHDCDNLEIIYEVIDLEPHGHGSRHANRRIIKKAKAHYRAILDKLSQGKLPSSRDEQRVYAMFGPHPKRHDLRQARDNIRCQTGQQDRFLAGVKRSGKYLERIKDIFRSKGLPEDLAYLPHVESSYNYEAYSKFGAAGIWQFTRSTGRRYMQVDYVVDERRDPIVSTYAAATFLKENFELLGCWALALTAYNHGPNGMLRAKKQKGNYERIFEEYNGSRFKFASRNFYSEFIAARHVAKNYRRYFGNVRLDRPVLYHTVEMTGYAPLARIAKFFHVSPHEIRGVNPALRRPVFEGQKHIPKGYRLRLPGQAQRMARISSALPSSLFEKQQKRSRFYRVQRGDTASKIARHHRVRLNDLVAANGLNRRATIYVGQNLRIPAAGEGAIQLASATRSPGLSQAEPTMATLKKKVLAKASVREVSRKPVHSVAKWRPQANPHGLIAAREEEAPMQPLVATAMKREVAPSAPLVAQAETVMTDVSSAPSAEEPDVKQLSPMGQTDLTEQPAVLADNDDVAPAPDLEPVAGEAEDAMVAAAEEVIGDEVAVTSPADLPGPLAASARVNPMLLVGNFDVSPVQNVKGVATGTIQVEVEETLGHYADWLEIPTRKIRRLNRFPFGRSIQYGQSLKLPFVKVSKEDFEERRYLYHKELVEDFFAAFTVEGEKSYTIKKGDNLWTLCHDDFELPFWLIKQYNADFDFHALRLGAEIKVPIVNKIDSDNQFAETKPAGPMPTKSLAHNIPAPFSADQ